MIWGCAFFGPLVDSLFCAISQSFHIKTAPESFFLHRIAFGSCLVSLVIFILKPSLIQVCFRGPAVARQLYHGATIRLQRTQYHTLRQIIPLVKINLWPFLFFSLARVSLLIYPRNIRAYPRFYHAFQPVFGRLCFLFNYALDFFMFCVIL